MSNPKLKAEHYQGFGGINVKFSPYVTGPMEFLDILNMDFQCVGALTQRWGSTNYIGATSGFPGPVRGLAEYSKLSGFSQIVFGFTGAMYAQGGATLAGVTIGAVGVTVVAPAPFYLIQWNAGSSAYVNQASFDAVCWGGNANLQLGNGSNYATMIIAAQSFGENTFDTTTFKDHLFYSNGNMYAKWNGQTLSRACMPHPFPWSVDFAVQSNSYKLAPNKNYTVALSYLSVTGDEGPILPIIQYTTNCPVALNCALEFQAQVPLGFGITGINVYINEGGATPGFWGATTTSAWNLPYYLYKSYGVTFGATLTTIDVGYASDVSFFTSNTLRNFGDAIAPGITIVSGNPGRVEYSNFTPKYIEQFQNSIFMSGFTGSPSSVIYTDIGTGERISPDSNFEVRTNDADTITCKKAYGQRLMIFKNESMHELTGDGTSNYSLKQVSGEYGCYNNRAVATYEDVLVFLDKKGIVEYNGATVDLLSFKIQPLIDRINQAAAVTHACMAHDKPRNQVLCSVPMDGATINNKTLVYDYMAKAWTVYDGFSPEMYMVGKGSLNARSVFFGSYSGAIQYFGQSLTSDASSGFTNYIKTRFNHEMGDSTQKQFRRLYANIDAPGSTLSIPVNFYQDYGASKVLSTTLVIGEFQSRLEYGISAKAIAFEMYYVSQAVPLKLHGYTIEERLQRKV